MLLWARLRRQLVLRATISVHESALVCRWIAATNESPKRPVDMRVALRLRSSFAPRTQPVFQSLDRRRFNSDNRDVCVLPRIKEDPDTGILD